MKIRKAVIPAAGLGTRFLPVTKAMPKEMLPIIDKPTIQYIVEEAVDSGIEEVLIITAKGKEAIADHFDHSVALEVALEKSGKNDLLEQSRNVAELANIHYLRQKNPRGLGHAVGLAKVFAAGEPIAVLLGDDVVYHSEKPALRQMMEEYERLESTVLGVQTVALEHVNKYGIIDGEKEGERLYRVRDMVEKPEADKAPSRVAALGRYILTPSIFEVLEHTKEGVGGEIQLTDAIKELAKKESVYAYDFEGTRYDVGTRLGFLSAGIEFALRREDLKEEFSDYLKYIVNTL